MFRKASRHLVNQQTIGDTIMRKSNTKETSRRLKQTTSLDVTMTGKISPLIPKVKPKMIRADLEVKQIAEEDSSSNSSS